MSVVGATQWYKRVADGQYNPKSDLILDKYCKEFIDEVKSLIPTEFYTGYIKYVHTNQDGRIKAIRPFTCFDGEGTARDHLASSLPGTSGSLMPFGKPGQYYRRNSALGSSNKQAHDSVSSWTIDKLGRVTIKRACILASGRLIISPSTAQDTLNYSTPTTRANATINHHSKQLSVFINSNPFNLTISPNVYKWARAGGLGVYLVVISSLLENAEYAAGFGIASYYTLIQGIVLSDVESEREETRGSQKLVPVGTFYTVPPQTKIDIQFKLPEECPIDWIVL